MLDINAMMNEEVKEELNKVVINGVLVGEFNDDVITKVMNILKGKTTKVSAPSVVEEEEKYPSVEPNVADEKKFMATDIVSVYYDDKKYKAFFDYGLISRMAYDKKKKERDDSKYENLKKMFKEEIKSYGAKWVSYNAEDDSDPRGWYQFPKKSNAEEYRKVRLAKDAEYEKKRKKA